jgi:death-on-curing protein
MTDWIWLDRAAIQAIHEEQLAEHGGGVGVRDEGLMDSALSRPQQLAHYGAPDAAAVAAAYGFGLARNHPFVDGNKRTAFVAAELFLALNGYDLIADDEACVLTVLALAAGTLTEEAFAGWIRQNLVKL